MITIEEILEKASLDFNKIEEDRLKQSKKNTKHILIVVPISIILFISLFLIFTFWIETDSIAITLIISASTTIIVSFIVISIVNSSSSQYYWDLRNKVLTDIIKIINPDCTYDMYKHMSESDFKKSKFTARKIDSYSGDDYFNYKIDNKSVSYSTLLVEKGDENDSHSLDSYERLFRGLFIKVKMNNHVKGSIIIVPKTKKKSLINKITHKTIKHKESIVEKEYNDFNKYFNVLTKNKAEVKQLLSNELIEFLLKTKDNLDAEIFFSMNKNELYFGIQKQNIFFINLQRINKDIIKKWYDEFISYNNTISQLIKITS